MFEKLLELLFHAKAGALAGILLIGTTGALVTATVSSSNGVTTITLTQASASPSGSASPSHSPSATPTHSASPTPTKSPSTSPSSSPDTAATAACTDETHAMSDAVKTVNAAFSKYHVDLMHMRNDPKSDAAKKIVDDADKLLKTLRQNAVKDIHATSACPKAEDDKDTTEQDDNTTDTNDKTDQNDETDNDKTDKTPEKSSEKSSEKNFIVILFNNLSGKNTSTTTTSTNTTTTNTTLTPTTTGDPKAIADAAVAAMKLAFDDATAKLQALPSASPKPTKAPHDTNTTKGKSNGKGNSRSDREGDD